MTAVSGKSVYVCDEAISTLVANNIFLESNTTGTCGGTLAQMDTTWFMPVNGAKTDANPYWRGLVTAAGSGVCVKTSAAGQATSPSTSTSTDMRLIVALIWLAGFLRLGGRDSAEHDWDGGRRRWRGRGRVHSSGDVGSTVLRPISPIATAI